MFGLEPELMYEANFIINVHERRKCISFIQFIATCCVLVDLGFGGTIAEKWRQVLYASKPGVESQKNLVDPFLRVSLANAVVSVISFYVYARQVFLWRNFADELNTNICIWLEYFFYFSWIPQPSWEMRTLYGMKPWKSAFRCVGASVDVFTLLYSFECSMSYIQSHNLNIISVKTIMLCYLGKVVES